MSGLVINKNSPEKRHVSHYFIIPIFIIVALLIVIPLTTIFILTQAYNDRIQNETHQASFYIQQTVESFMDGAYTLSAELAVNAGVLNMDGEVLAPLLADCADRNDYMVLLYITGMDGMQVARSSGQLGDRSGRFWFIQMTETEQPFVSPSYYSLTSNVPCTSVFLPIYGKEPNEMIGIFGTDIDLAYLQRLTEQFANPDNGRYSFIIDGEGVVIAHPDSVYLDTLTNFKTLIRTVSVMDDNGNPILNRDTSVVTREEVLQVSDDFKAVIDAVMSGSSGLSIVEYNNSDYYMSYEPISMPGYSDSWSVITMQDRSIAMSVVTRLILQVSIIIGFILAVFIPLVVWVSRTLRRTMANLEFANERFGIMLDTSPIGAHLWDENYNLIDCNQALVKMFNLTTKQEYIERYLELTPEFQPDGWRSVDGLAYYIQKAFDEGYVQLEWMRQTPDGELIPVETTLVLVDYKDKKHIASYYRDLREQKRMIAVMHEREYKLIRVQEANELQLLKLNAVVKATKIGLWEVAIVDNDLFHPDNKFTWSDDFRKMLGYSDETDFPNVFNSWRDRLHPDDQVAALENVVRHISDATGTTPYDAQYRLMKKDGEYSYIRAYGETIRDNSGYAIHFAGALMDITEEKNILHNTERLRQEAEIASKSKSNFLANMSHEIRTPMNAIIGMTAIGKKTADIKEKNHALNKIGDASSHLLGVINDVLDMAKIEADKLELSPVEYHFERMLQKILTVVNFRIDEKHQKLIINIENKVPRFLIGDEQRLAQIITNLLSNAVKFTPEKGEIRFNTFLVYDDGEYCKLQIEVADSGIGISEEQKKRLFHAFEQAEAGTNRKYGGTGLGLAISKRIIELMGGSVWVESELGKGAKFAFTMKVKRSDICHSSMLAPDINWKNVRILVVDDMEDIREQLQELFEQLEIHCDVAADGFEACRIIEEQGAYDIYFIDWCMPGMDGIELTRRIKESAPNKPSVVTMITAADWDQIKDEALQAGVNKCLIKPLMSSMIIDSVNEIIGIANEIDVNRAFNIGEFKGKRLLVAEDVEINREILLALLENTGLEIDCAENGEAALKMVEAAPEKYDLVFMDVQMPFMDGYEATRRIRTFYEGPGLPERQGRLPIVALTANVFTSDIEDCLAAGMDDHLGKPLDIDRVIEKLREYLK